MNKEQIAEQVREIIQLFVITEDDCSIVISDYELLQGEDFGLDSLALVQIIIEIERRFDIEIDDEYLTMDFLSSIAAITEFIFDIMEGG